MFCLENLIKDTTCDTIYGSSSIDVIFTNRKKSLMKSSTVNTGISDCHKMVLTVMRAHYERLKPMKIQYRSYRNFNEKDFLRDLGHMPFHKCNQMRDKENAYNCFKEIFTTVVDKHAPVKTRFLRGNQASFVNQELSKAIMRRSKLLNKFRKTKSDIDWNAYKKQRNKCVSIRRKNIREHFTKLCNNGGIANKNFLDTVKPFLTDKGTHHNQALILREND